MGTSAFPASDRRRSNRDPVSAGVIVLLAGVCLSGTAASADDRKVIADSGVPVQSEAPASRVFSRNNPLFKQRMPEVTPDRAGRTRAVVIVPPAAESSAAKASGAKTSAASRRAPAPAKSRARDETVRLAPSAYDRSVQKSLRRQSKPVASPYAPRTTGAVGDAARVSKPADGRSATAPAKPAAGAKSAERARRQAGQQLPSSVEARVQPAPWAVAPVGRPQPAGRTRKADDAAVFAGLRDRPVSKKRRRVSSRRSVRRRRAARRHHGAPPGTIATFVRCRPRGGCVRFYRVRRPRTYRQYRRLRAWQRRRNAAYYRSRYRRRY